MKKGIVFGAFDLLHAGHVHLLRECKKRCDYLIVCIHADPSVERPEKNKPIESILERTIKVANCKPVNEVFVYETENDLKNLLNYCNPDVRFLGIDYAKVDPNNPPKITAESLVPIEYIDSLPIHTSDIRRRIK